MKRLLGRAAEYPWRLMPRALRTAALKAAVFAAVRQPVKAALVDLLELDRAISGQIDLAAIEYGDGVHVKHRLMGYHDFFVHRIHRGERVLDIGCGYGAVAHSIVTRAGARVTGIDMDRANIEKARQKFAMPNLTFVLGEVPGDLQRDHFDVAVLSNVLEHIESRTDFLRELSDKATPSRLLIRVPMFNREWRVPLRAELGLFAYSDPTHFTEYTQESFEREMADAGFAITHLQINWGEIWAEVVPHA